MSQAPHERHHYITKLDHPIRSNGDPVFSHLVNKTSKFDQWSSQAEEGMKSEANIQRFRKPELK